LRESVFKHFVHAYDNPIEGARVLGPVRRHSARSASKQLSRGAAFTLFVDNGGGGPRVVAQ